MIQAVGSTGLVLVKYPSRLEVCLYLIFMILPCFILKEIYTKRSRLSMRLSVTFTGINVMH